MGAMKRLKKGATLSRYCMACRAPSTGPAEPTISHCAACCPDCAKLLGVKVKRLKKGEVLVKKGGVRARVVRTWRWVDGWPGMVQLAMLASSRRGHQLTVLLGEDGLPPGWRRSTVEHDWPGTRCLRAGCNVRRWPGSLYHDGRERYQRSPGAVPTLTCPPCEGKP